jgi:hypothetical protein
VPHTREGEGLHLPPVPEALNRVRFEIESDAAPPGDRINHAAQRAREWVRHFFRVRSFSTRYADRIAVLTYRAAT